jgi:hypothetical protein
LVAAVMQRQRIGSSAAKVLAADKDCIGGRVGRSGRGRDGAFLVKRGQGPCNKEGRKAAAAVWQERQQRLRGEEGSGGRAARKAVAAVQQGRQWRPRGKEGSGGAATKVVVVQQGRQRQCNNGSAYQKRVRSGGNVYQHAPEGVAGDALP